MEGLRWWLLLLTAVMFSMAGCAARGEDWSTQHLAFSMKTHHTEASITEEVVSSSACPSNAR